jgi:prepilin-type N-terminal cleavage/methylation domain-containing protein
MVRLRRRTSGGFTLIELLVSMALSTVGLLGLMALQMIAVRGNMMSRNFGEAIGIAQQRLEIAGHTPYASLSTLADPACTVSGSTVSGGAPNLSPTQDSASTQAIYNRCTVVPAANANNTTNVQVTVYWNDTMGNLHSVVLETRRSP